MLKVKFYGYEIEAFLSMNGGMPEQATPFRVYSKDRGYDYDCFRFACDDYMRCAWEQSIYRNKNCTDIPSHGKYRYVQADLLRYKKKKVEKTRKSTIPKRKSACDVLTPENKAFLLSLQNGRCPSCEAILAKCGYHVDHIMPKKLGGTDDAWNFQLLCHGCNVRKSSMHPDEWARMNGIRLPMYYVLKRDSFG